ncbi:unnamed protein product [Ranitomeya imitator]|uniref:Large ribosomal subunit protein mL52 n=1 Tax=Ranitomeya imitator TaxID=111125 RepID=A0ABN9M399_9NEOB|nr:unnamed protein product [Ranitomeya imitator]
MEEWANIPTTVCGNLVKTYRKHGRAAPPMKGQSRRKEENKELASRIIMFSKEMDEGMKKWTEKQESLQEQKLLKQKNQLKPKAIYRKS